MTRQTADLSTGEWRVLEQLARETGKRLRGEHIPSRLVDLDLVAADGGCWKLTKRGWCLVMFRADPELCPLDALSRQDG